MRFQTTLTLAAVGALLIADGAPAQEAQAGGPDDFQIILSLAPSEGSCPDEETETIALNDLLKDTESRLGKCVATEGYAKARALFLNRRDMHMRRPSSNAASARRRIGFYGSERMMEAVARHDGKRIRVTGLLFDCADIGGPGDLVLGYCHYTGGPVIALTSVEPAR